MLYCSYCGRIIKPYDTWYLYDSNKYYNRYLEIGKCIKCKDDIAILYEHDKNSGERKITKHYREKATELIDNCICSLMYREKDLINKKGRPYGYIYGENRQQKEDVVVYACDFFGNKEKLQKRI